MALDYNTLSTWRTEQLVSRDTILSSRTRVMGMSETAATIHIVTLVCTAGISLPINLAFYVWHSPRYDEMKRERMWIRQILGTRNMAYLGRGQWVRVQPTPNARPREQPIPTPNRRPKARPTPNTGQQLQEEPTPNRRQRVHVTPTPRSNNGPQMQYAHALPQ